MKISLPCLCMLLIASALAACEHLKQLDTVDSQIRGGWVGHSRFLDVVPHRKYGTFPVSIKVHGDNAGTGTVGAALLLRREHVPDG